MKRDSNDESTQQHQNDCRDIPRSWLSLRTIFLKDAPAAAPIEISEIRASIDEAAKQTRGLTFLFLLVGLYIAILAGTTTHKMILLGQSINLPLLNVNVSITWAYVLTPLLYLIMHFWLLMELLTLAYRIDLLEIALSRLPASLQNKHRALLSPFPFVEWRAGGRERSLESILGRIVNTIIYVLLPVSLFLWIQLHLLPYQHPWITPLHFACLTADITLLGLIWPRLNGPSRSAPHRIVAACGASAAIFLGLLLWYDQRSTQTKWLDRVAGFVPWPQSWCASTDQKSVSATVRTCVMYQWSYIDLQGEILTSDQPNLGLVQSMAPATSGEQNNEAPNPVYIRKEMLGSLDLSGRNLRHANFSRSRMWGARLDGADLTGANLSYADLSFSTLHAVQMLDALAANAVFDDTSSCLPYSDDCQSDFSGAVMSGALMRRAQLAGAILESADLRKADLSEANLSDANLRKSNLLNARFDAAEMSDSRVDGADLTGARLAGTNLSGASLRHVVLRGADMTAARLDHSDLFSANLNQAKLAAATFVHANLEGALLNGVEAERSDFTEANLRGAQMRQANLRDSTLVGVRMSASELLDARFQGSDLRFAHLIAATGYSAEFQGANLQDSRMQAADFTAADFTGAEMGRVRVAGAKFYRAKFDGASLRGAFFQGADLTSASFIGVDLRGVGFFQATAKNASVALSDLRDTTFDDGTGIHSWIHQIGPMRLLLAQNLDDQRVSEVIQRLSEIFGRKVDGLTEEVIRNPGGRNLLSQDKDKIGKYVVELVKWLSETRCEDKWFDNIFAARARYLAEEYYQARGEELDVSTLIGRCSEDN